MTGGTTDTALPRYAWSGYVLQDTVLVQTSS